MAKFTENPKYKKYDTRSFIEIYFTLPDAGRQLLLKEFHKRKIISPIYMRWLRGTLPNEDSMKKIRNSLHSAFGINTLPYTLFPEKEIRKYLARKYFAQPEKWDGRVRWKNLEREQNEDPQEDELKYLEV